MSPEEREKSRSKRMERMTPEQREECASAARRARRGAQ